jgi:hypothetical protein
MKMHKAFIITNRSPELWRYRQHAVGFCRPNLQKRV